MFVDQWLKNLPIITKTYMLACILTTLAVEMDLISFLKLYLNFDLIYNKGEVWRLGTNFLFFGEFGLYYIFHMCFLVRHSRLLEENSFRGRTGDFLFLYLFGAVILLILDWVFWYTSIVSNPMFLGQCLAFMVVYVWARRNPHARMSFLGIFTFNAPMLPYVIIGIELLVGQSFSVFDLMGIFAGHLYYFLMDVYPVTSGRRLLKTPAFMYVE
eukprot:TRINITY_DN3201_c0_g1_i3.p1 TRINITY_DN3201_c0_g1~~TRINITY_DN3201_c0_g1_i3.p1  ORF type:complete len:213 (+),score=18.90 TRINITY_DN3201_c0_g1_i3:15-653(+)